MAETKIDAHFYELAHGRQPHAFHRGIWDFAEAPPPALSSFCWHGVWWEARAEAQLWGKLQGHPKVWLLP